jgi:GH25 family lysozyme M1 (1,4-beta-N-acetylmuramidase)
MKIRTECPKKNNKYYNNKSHGGLSDAVNGYPMISGLTVLDNCVGWANSRFNEICNDPNLEGIVKKFKYQLVCNAENFIESAKKQGLKISYVPVEGGIMVWQKGATLSGGDGAGHVAVVERVYNDGTILTSESGWASWTFKTVRRDNTNGRWGQNEYYRFRGCIINPTVKDPKVVPVPPLTVDGIGGACTVRAMQRFFGTLQDGVLSGQNKNCAKYYPALKAVEYGKGGSTCVKKLQSWLGISTDGVWGEKTSKALQKKLGVEADGIFGTNSVKALQKFLNKYQKATDVPAQSTPSVEPDKDKKVYNFIDVSDWQSKIDWAKVKAAGIDGAIIRYADGTTLDKRFTENMTNAINAGLHVGSYIFSRAKTKAEAEKEAERLFNACKPYKYDMPLYIDLEVSTLAKYADTVAAAFLNKMAALGARGGVYANLNWWNNYLTKTAKNYSASAFWIAQYNDTMDYKPASRMGMWQYTSSGKVNGIEGKVDRDKCYVAYWEKKPDPGGKEPEPEKPKAYAGEYPSTKLEKTPAQVTADALLFSKWIVNDNRFGYGRQGGSKYKDSKAYKITHSGGCHFCGSNAHKIAEAKKAGLKDPEQWEYTYVCNTFVHACYAHAGVPSMLKAKGHAWWIGSYQKSKYWTEIKKPSKITDLKPGDVLAWGSNGGTSGHFCMYVGNGKGREATSNGLGATFTQAQWNSSIRETNFSRHFKAAQHVFRLTGSINTTANIRYGEVSDRVKLLQEFLKWYGYDIAADKCFGDATLKAVKKFQKEQGITVDGIVGSATIAKMKSVRK